MTARRFWSTARVFLPLTSAVASALASVSCGASQRPADVVVFASGSDLESANPLVTIHPLSRQVQRHVLFVTLVRWDSALTPQPYFAREWGWSPDRRSLRLRLHAGLRWHDGVPTTASDAAFTLLAGRDRRVGFARAAELSVLDTAIAHNDTTLELRFAAAQRDLPPLLAELPIVPRHLLGTIGPGEMRRAAFSTNPVGNGPFKFSSRVAGQRWTFTRNDDFPPELGGPPRIRELVVAVVDEPTTKFAGLAAGDLDFAGIAPTMARMAERDPVIEVVDYPVLFSNALILNVHRKPFDDSRVRRAIDVSIDRARLLSAALAGYGTPASGPVPPENPLARQSQPKRDPGLADSLLDAAGYPRASGGARQIEVELLTVSTGDNAVEQLIQADLAECGIRVRIRQLELAAFLERARARQKDFDLLITGIPGDLSLAYLAAMYESSQGGSSLDYSGFHTATLDAAFARARGARTGAESKTAWDTVQAELAREVPAVWLYHSRGVQGVASRMQNVVMDLRGELVTVARWTTTGAPADRARPVVAER